jgi:hypothetical protein
MSNQLSYYIGAGFDSHRTETFRACQRMIELHAPRLLREEQQLKPLPFALTEEERAKLFADGHLAMRPPPVVSAHVNLRKDNGIMANAIKVVTVHFQTPKAERKTWRELAAATGIKQGTLSHAAAIIRLREQEARMAA